MSKYPKAINPSLVGEYPALTESGGGYFFDEVLEYRVWCPPEKGAPDEFGGEDYYSPFETYEDALAFSQTCSGAEVPLVLIRQLEWIDEPEPDVFNHMKEERLTEWLPEWLSRGARVPGAIEAFIAERSHS